MKKITLFLALILCGGGVVAQNKVGGVTVFGKKVNPESISPDGYIRCASTEYEEYLRDQTPKMETTAQFESWISKKIKEQKAGNATFSTGAGDVIYIPVVVHVIHNGDAYGISENITDEQVQSQITVMTQDFRRMVGTPGFNSDAVGADTKIEFVLAKVDPNGNPTNGIDRVNMCKASWSTPEINGIVKPATIWNPSDYMNMWSVNFTSATLLGYAQFPQSNLGGISLAAQNANTDGVVAGYKFFGSAALAAGATVAPFNGGRTMTHEVGHFLGLRHIWGDNAACPAANTTADEDFVADTPAASAPNYVCPAGTDSCPANPGEDMIANYMDYTDDACMNIFTVGQAARVATVMANSPRRASLATSQKDIAIPLFATDAQVVLDGGACTTAITCASANPAISSKTVLLYNRGTSNLTSATLTYNFTGAATYTYNWVGSLATNKYAVITLPNTAQYGVLNVSVSNANGGVDQRSTNNTSTRDYLKSYYNYNAFTFNLVGDAFGSETTWDLKDAAGAILHSGGPYTDLTAVGTQNLVTNQLWNLPANGCYVLTVRDSWGDGIMPNQGSGYFTVTANNGAVSVINNTYFDGPNTSTTVAAPNSVVHYFTNNANLDSESFNVLESVTLYPNPSKDFFTLDVPQSVLRAGKLEVYNNLGQKVMVKAISSDSDLNVNVSSLSRGVYILNLNLEDSTKTLKFIKE